VQKLPWLHGCSPVGSRWDTLDHTAAASATTTPCRQFAEEATVIETAGVVRQLITGARDDMLKWQQTFGVWGEKTKRAMNRGLLKVPLFSGRPESTPF
jgi:hypothetical protein